MPILHERDRRGGGRMGWLETAHSFSFGNFMDPNRMGFRALRVLNEDRVIPGAGFSRHAHADMDIITYVISGALRHEDSLGNGSIIKPGDIQLMSAGSGITHSEMNASDDDPVHFLQIWIIPEKRGGAPGYQQETIDRQAAQRRFIEIAGPDPHGRAVRLISDTKVMLRLFGAGDADSYTVDGSRGAFVQVVRGNLEIHGQPLAAGDGLQVDGPESLDFTASTFSEILLFDLA